ncbi:MAG: type II toxin-antitoxin system Phd/YefM family antitoxin [Elusimicrobia bacterium]|nr:type II toxin-antitoxin system Phd/YefM family antitoxin [Elusimicrobiota bacterium]
MTKIAPVSYVRAHLPELVAALGKKRRGRVIITRNGTASAVLMSPEELETIEILADKKLMLSLLKAEEDERALRLVEHEDIFK